ncbi:Asp23/Gls24 family envelope stress response protein [Georgenia sp. EYE_87]|nr:Asp23/Gls24 family envelope stress response protein [Georgenia sp. EYE_87]
MSQTSSNPPGQQSGGAGRDVSQRSGGPSALVTEHGRTSIADGVVAKIAGIATREVDGVYAVGGGTARAMGAVRERVGAKTHAQGVSVEVGERQAAADIDVVVEYGMAIADVAEGVRRNVMSSIQRMTGLEVTEVNVHVGDIHIPGDDEEAAADEPQEARVR